MWPWLRHMEESGSPVDVVRECTQIPPKTRVGGYMGASGLDRMYASKELMPPLQCALLPCALTTLGG